MAGGSEGSRSSVSVILKMFALMMIAAASNHGVVVAQSPAPSSGCVSSLISLSPCLGYITSNFTNSPPTQACCSALASVVKNSAVCLCQLMTTTNPLGIPINQTRALALPGACKITTPPISKCKAAGVPAPAPSTSAGSSHGAPAPSSSSSPAPATSTSTPAAVSPSAESPSFLPPTTSVGGISPAGSVDPTSNAQATFTTSTIISVLVGMIVAITF